MCKMNAELPGTRQMFATMSRGTVGLSSADGMPGYRPILNRQSGVHHCSGRRSVDRGALSWLVFILLLFFQRSVTILNLVYMACGWTHVEPAQTARL